MIRLIISSCARHESGILIMKRNKKQQGISKIIEEPDIEFKKDEYTIWDYLHGFFWVVLIVTFVVPVYAAIANPPSQSLTSWLLIAFIVLDYTISIFYLVLTIPTDNRIISKLNRMGYKCYLDEGQKVFERKEYSWYIVTYDIKKRYRRVAFVISFSDERLDIDHALTNRIFSIVGSRNSHTHISWNGKDSYHCVFETVLTSTRDIEREFNTAMEKMDDTLGELSYLFEQAFAQQSTEPEHKIGFHVSDSDSPSEENPFEIRAQTNDGNNVE